MSSKTKCEEIPHLLDKEPDIYFPGEAGSLEIWNLNCDGLYVGRYTIHPNGLLLPYYTNADEFAYILRGESKTGFFFECSGNLTAEKNENENECGQFYRYRSADVGTRNGGELLWDYNDGN
ncbi:hypothetical protein M5689_019329 [Euphorbia peplus]|nr:hypothetical protein M5689_019329 [Euphorbia peplus]